MSGTPSCFLPVNGVTKGIKISCFFVPVPQGGEILGRRLSRRQFIKWGFCWGAAAGLAGCGLFPSQEGEEKYPGKEKPGEISDPDQEEERTESNEKKQENRYPVPRRVLGKTGEKVSVVGLGGAIAVAGNPGKAEAVVSRALDLGINYVDTAAGYGDSEENIGRVMRERREEAFLASKTEERSYDGAMREFERSLERLQTDYLDLYQLHGVHRRDGWERLKAEDGGLQALRELKRQGVVRFTGVTGHKNAPLLKEVVQEHSFDCVLLSLNAGDVHYDSMLQEVIPAAREKEMGIVAMKVASYDGRIFREDGIRSMEQSLGYVLSCPVSTAIIGISDLCELEENISIAREFKPFSEGKMKELEELTRHYEREVNFFKHHW